MVARADRCDVRKKSCLRGMLREMKPQIVRLADVFVIGPLMVWAGFQLQPRHRMAGPLLAAFGLGTVVYNARNYALRAQQHQKGSSASNLQR